MDDAGMNHKKEMITYSIFLAHVRRIGIIRTLFGASIRCPIVKDEQLYNYGSGQH
jgi:hypothetical protein